MLGALTVRSSPVALTIRQLDFGLPRLVKSCECCEAIRTGCGQSLLVLMVVFLLALVKIKP